MVAPALVPPCRGHRLSDLARFALVGVRRALLSRPPAVVTAGLVFATWNPSDKAANLALSGGNLTVTQSTAQWDTLRSTIAKSSGKWYWEITCVSGFSGTSVMTGIADATTGLANHFLADGTGTAYGYQSANGNKQPNAAYGASYTNGDVIGVAFDATGGTIVFYKNNASQGTAFTGISGTFYAAMSMFSSATPVITANFGATALTYTPPAGFNAGLYT